MLSSRTRVMEKDSRMGRLALDGEAPGSLLLCTGQVAAACLMVNWRPKRSHQLLCWKSLADIDLQRRRRMHGIRVPVGLVSSLMWLTASLSLCTERTGPFSLPSFTSILRTLTIAQHLIQRFQTASRAELMDNIHRYSRLSLLRDRLELPRMHPPMPKVLCLRHYLTRVTRAQHRSSLTRLSEKADTRAMSSCGRYLEGCGSPSFGTRTPRGNQQHLLVISD